MRCPALLVVLAAAVASCAAPPPSPSVSAAAASPSSSSAAPPPAPSSSVPSPPSAAPAASAAPAGRGAEALADVYASALEGDMRAAMARLAAIPLEALGDGERRQRACLLERFSASKPAPAPPAGDPLLASVMAAYRDYWTRVLEQQLTVDEGKTYLSGQLRAVLGPPVDAGAPPRLDRLLDALGAALSKRGIHSVRGVTAPYQDLLAWRNETRKSFDVRVPEGTRRVEVVLMRDFVSLGWEGFATCDRSYPGGWAEKDRLYCKADSYDLESEHFSVSYLAHETQHFVDYERFPKLEGPELEYRAKLVELIESRQSTRELVARFAGQTGESRDSPHGYANGVVTRELARALGAADAGPRWWESVAEDRIRSAARAVFDESTRRLVSKGAATVSAIL